jgi:hypothetical protein
LIELFQRNSQTLGYNACLFTIYLGLPASAADTTTQARDLLPFFKAPVFRSVFYFSSLTGWQGESHVLIINLTL